MILMDIKSLQELFNLLHLSLSYFGICVSLDISVDALFLRKW